MADPVLHIKDAYFFEVPKVLWPSTRNSRTKFPDVWVSLDPEFQEWEFARLYREFNIFYDLLVDPQIDALQKDEAAFDFMTVLQQTLGVVTMVPVRSMLLAMDGTMRWDLANQTLTGWKGGKRFDVVLNSRTATVNEKAMTMEEAPLIFKNRIYVPLKFVADATGYIISVENGWYVLRPPKK